jgi:hypothetical protein
VLLPFPHRADGFVIEVDGLAVCRPDFGGGGLNRISTLLSIQLVVRLET